MSPPHAEPLENPFSTRRVKPGAVPYLFANGDSAAGLVERLAANGWRGEIVGPHGSGKSTLVQTLLPELKARGREPLYIQLREGVRRLPLNGPTLAASPENTVVVVDGYEQLGWWARWKLRRLCRRCGLGLLATAHVPTGLPPLYQVTASRDLADRVVGALLADRPDAQPVITSTAIEQAWQAAGGNLRETLFLLYDVYERSRRNREA